VPINRGADDHRRVSELPRKPYTVLIADDHPIVREGLAALINRTSDMQVVAEASDGREAVENMFHNPLTLPSSN
jgi:CheY-like chemotaxis protein